MIGQIFQSRFRVESETSGGRTWRSWIVRDIINNRPSLLFIYPPGPGDRGLDRRSVAWGLLRYQELLGDRVARTRLYDDDDGLALLCDLPEGATSVGESPLPEVLKRELDEDRRICEERGMPAPFPDGRVVWRDRSGLPLYLPPALFDDPDRPEPLDQPLESGSVLRRAALVLPEEIQDILRQSLETRDRGRAVILNIEAGRPGGLAAWRPAIEAWLRENGGRQFSEPGAPLHILEDFTRPSALLDPFWSRNEVTTPTLLLLDVLSLQQDAVLERRVGEMLDAIKPAMRSDLHLPAFPTELPSSPPEDMSPEERSFIDLLSLMGDPVPLGFLLELLQVEEGAFYHLLSSLERKKVLASRFANLPDRRRGLSIAVAHPELCRKIREGIDQERSRELHLLIIGMIERGRSEDLPAALRLFLHRVARGMDEAVVRDGRKLFGRLRDGSLELAALSVADRLLELDRAALPPVILREISQYLGNCRLRRDDLSGAEAAYREGLSTLTGSGDFLAELRHGRKSHQGPRMDGERLSAVSALVRALAEVGEIRGEFSFAGDILEGLLNTYSETLSAHERGLLHNELAWILYRRGDNKKAVERCETALRLFDAREHPAELGQTFNTLGAAQWALGSWREAEAYYKKALDLREKTGDETRIAASLNNLGNLYRMREQLPKAIEYFQRSMEIKRRQGNEAGYLVSLFNVALSSFEMDDLKTARRQGEECLELNQKVGNIQLGAEVLGLLGEIDLVEGRPIQARERLEEAVRVCKDIGAGTELASMYRRLAGVHLDGGNLEGAATAIAEGLTESRRVGSRFEEAQILIYRGEYESRHGEPERAIAALEAAADILSVLDKVEWLARTYSRLGLIHLEAGREGQAQEMLQQASGIIERRRIAVPMQEWDTLQARIQSRRERFIEGLGEAESRVRLTGFLRILEAMESGQNPRDRAEQVLDQLATFLPCRRTALFLAPEKADTGELDERAVLHGDFPDLAELTRTVLGFGKMLQPLQEQGRFYLPLRFGEKGGGLLFLEAEENLDESNRDFMATMGKLLAIGLEPDSRAAAPAKRGGRRREDPAPGQGRAPRLIGRGRDIQRVMQLVSRVKDLSSTVLITGESGTGKEEVAKAIHYNSVRSSLPFMTVNCAAVTETLLESELFGHERGSFTGATHRHQGYFEVASGGTIFLDEIGEMSPAMQAKMLRVLQEKQFVRVGGTRTLNTDARVITATHRDLVEEINQGRFREDLFFRINVISLPVAPLRNKREDIPLLVEYFLELLAREEGLQPKRVSEETMQVFLTHPWPGNIRQLQNVLKSCLILARRDLIAIEDLPEDFLQQAGQGEHSRSLDELAEMLIESEAYSEAEPLEPKLLPCLAHHLVRRTGSKVMAAKLLGISRPTLYARLKEYESRRKQSR